MSHSTLKLEKFTYEGVEYMAMQVGDPVALHVPATFPGAADDEAIEPGEFKPEPWIHSAGDNEKLDQFFNVLLMSAEELQKFAALQNDPDIGDGFLPVDSILVAPSGIYRGSMRERTREGSLLSKRRNTYAGPSRQVYEELAKLGFPKPPYYLNMTEII